MVLSKINPKIIYQDNSEISAEDDEFESLVYPIEISFKKHDKSSKKYNIVFGKVQNDKKIDGIIYFPIYLVIDDEAVAKIGVLEIESQKYAFILDDNDDIDPEKIPEPLFFNFVTEDYLKQYDKKEHVTEEVSDNEIEIIPVDPDEEFDVETGMFKQKQLDNDKDDLFNIPKDKMKLSEKSQKPTIIDKTSVFTIDNNNKTSNVLLEESNQDALDLRSQYQETTKSNWINKFMENNEYNIEENEAGGDCLFAVIRDSFEQIGHYTTVDKLRELLASEVTDSIYQSYRQVFDSIENSIIENDKKIKRLTDIYRNNKNKIKKMDNSLSQQEHFSLIEQAKQARDEIKILQDENRLNNEFLRSELGYMKNIDTFDKFKNFILTSSFWADTWAITTLENKLNFKLIIFAESAFNQGSHDTVLNCGETIKEIESRSSFTPNYYIMTSYSGDHYRLITYKNKKIFSFQEIPYDVKTLVINKCMERNSGIFYLIQDFKILKSKIGLPADEGKPEKYDLDDQLDTIYDKDIVFMFYSKSQNAAAGKGSGETIPSNKLIDFKNLNKINDWRRKLDDSWNKAKFKLDGHYWASVEHYYQASKFKKGFPDFYLQFSLDSKDSKISEDVALAKLAGGKKSNEYRPKSVIIDPDFYGERNIEERTEALRAKFQQNIDLREMLLLTYPAKLTHFVRRSPAEVDEPLMRIRKEISEKAGI